MKYYIQRQSNEYGPYTLADLQRYVAQGSILLTDLTRSEGMTEWAPVSQVIGNIPIAIPAMPGPAAQGYGGAGAYASPAGNAYSGTVYSGAPAMQAFTGPIPPDLHWAAVLLFGFFTCSLFWWAWWIVEAAFLRKLNPESKGLLLVVLSLVSLLVGLFVNGFDSALRGGQTAYYGVPFAVLSFIMFIGAEFQMKSDMEDHYTTGEPINLQLNGFMTFFFSVWYFQHHLSRIAQWKKTGHLQPQS